MESKKDLDQWVSDTVDKSHPRLSTHFLTKFENQNKNSLLSPIFDQVATKIAGEAPSKCLLVSKKHSGSLLMAPPFYSKNSTANRFSRMGAITMRDYMCAVWGDPVDKPKMFTAWWVDAEKRGLCYSFELVVPRILGDHGATPDAAYLVLTTVALTSGKSSRFLSPAEVIELATRWRLPLNQVWYFPSESAVAVEQALHNARWTLKDSQVDDVLSSVGGPSMVRQSFLTHLETQGEVLEGFVLMALEVASMNKLTEFVKAYNKEMAPCHDRVLKAALALGKRCKERDPTLEKLITSVANGGVEIMLDAALCVPAPEPTVFSTSGDVLWESVSRAEGDVGGLFRRLRYSYRHKATLKAYKYSLIGNACSLEVQKANETRKHNGGGGGVAGVASAGESETPSVPFFDGKCRRCWKKGHKAVDCPKGKKKAKVVDGDTTPPPSSPIVTNPVNQQAQKGVNITSPLTLSQPAESTGNSSGVGFKGQEVLQVQIDINDDNVFYSWPLHVASGGCASLYRGLVIQFDPSSSKNDDKEGGEATPLKNKKRSAESSEQLFDDLAASVGIESKIEMRILGIEKLKCLNYIWRTFGVRNQMTCLLSQGTQAYLRRCKTGFFKNWSVPTEHHAGMLSLFEGWANHISGLSKKEKEKAFSRETYLDKLDEYLNSGSPFAQKASHIVSGILTNTSGASISGGGGGGGGGSASKKDDKTESKKQPMKASTKLANFYVVVSNLTGKELPHDLLQKFDLFKKNMLKDKPNTFTNNKWLLAKDNIPLPWMFDGGSKQARKSRNKGGVGGKTTPALNEETEGDLVNQIAIVFGPPPEQMQGIDNPKWKHVLDQGPAGWCAKNKNIPLFVNPQEDISSFLKSLDTISHQIEEEKEKQQPEPKKQKKIDKPMVIVVGILALPPGGGKSTFFNILQQKTNAVIVSSDECTMKKKKFDSELARVIKNAHNSNKNQYVAAAGNDQAAAAEHQGGQVVKVIGYDKNIPDETGFEKMIRILRPCASENIDLRIAIVVPGDIDRDQCWSRVSSRGSDYLLSPAKMPLKDCEKVFENFYKMTSSFLIKAQSFVSNQSCITDCFFNQPGEKSNDGGVTKCSQLIDNMIQGSPPLFSQSLDAIEDAMLADSSTGVELGGGSGGGSGGKVNWCAANVIGTSLHMTLVPPPGSRNVEVEKDRSVTIKRLKAKTGQKITLQASKYHIAEVKEDTKENAKTRNKEARKRVGFWEIDNVIGLEENEHFASQRLNYHITDVGSLGNSTKPFASFEVLSEAGGRGCIGSGPSDDAEASETNLAKKMRAEDNGASNLSSNSSSSLSRSTSSHVEVTQVGQWSVRTFHLIQPLSVEAVITMK